MKKRFGILFLLMAALPHGLLATGQTLKQTIHCDGRTRDYTLYLPDGHDAQKPAPLVLAFHGGGGNSEQAMKHYGWNPLADRHGFIVCYPNAANRHWNDGRTSEVFREENTKLDDVGFVVALLDRLQKEYRIDPDRVFATGASNGGMFSQRLAIECTGRFAAIASLIASVPEELAAHFHPSQPISILMINGTDDPFVPYTGGDVRVSLFPSTSKHRKPKSRGKVLSTDAAIELWLKHNHLSGLPVLGKIPDTAPRDGTTAIRKSWNDPKRNISVELIAVEGGGHTCPGANQYLPEHIIGKTSRDFDATETIWKFFAAHGRRKETKGTP